MPTYLTPGAYVEEIPSATYLPLGGAPTSVAGCFLALDALGRI